MGERRRTLTPGVEPIASEEHREEQHDPRICAQRYPEAPELCFPRRVLWNRDACAVRPDHAARVDHQQRYEHAYTRQDDEPDLQGPLVSPSATEVDD